MFIIIIIIIIIIISILIIIMLLKHTHYILSIQKFWNIYNLRFWKINK